MGIPDHSVPHQHLLPSVFTLVTFTSFLWMFLPSSVGNTGPLNFISIFKLNLSLGSIQVKFTKNYDRPQKMYVLKQHTADLKHKDKFVLSVGVIVYNKPGKCPLPP